MTIHIDPNSLRWESETEPHPYRHEYDPSQTLDYVYDRNSRMVLTVIKRVESCKYCNTKRIRIINVTQWEVVSSYYQYDKTQTIVRVSKQTWLKQQVIASCNDEDIRKELQRQKG